MDANVWRAAALALVLLIGATMLGPGAALADESPPDFALYAGEHLILGEGARVRGGAVGVGSTLRAPGDEREFRIEILGARVDGDVYGDSVRLGPRSRVGDVYTNLLSETGARKGRVLPLSLELPPLAAVARNAPGVDEIVVASRARVALGPRHTRIRVDAGGTLILPGGRFDLELLELGEDSRLEVERPSVLAISRGLKIGPRAYVGPAVRSVALNLTILVGGVDGIAPATVHVEDLAELRALVLAPTGSVRVGDGVRVRGALQGRTIDVGPRVDIVYGPGLFRPSSDFQCVLIECSGGAGGALDCHSAPASGVACSDGNLCTDNDACDGEGRCAGLPIPDPDPNGLLPCVRDTCHPVHGIYEPTGTACVADTGFGLECVQSQWCDGQGLCSNLMYFPDGTACDDGIPDNGADQCFGGGCVAADYCQVNTCGGNPSDPDDPADLTCWLATHPKFKNGLAWRGEDDGGWIGYDLWPAARKQELKAAFEAAWRWLGSGLTDFQGTPLPEPLPNAKPLADLDGGVTGLSEAHARALYFAHVGHALALEIRGDLPWSLCDHLATAHDFLSAGLGHYWTLNPVVPGGPPLYEFRGAVTPAHPTVTYAFLTANGLIGSTRFETIGKLLDWSRRLAHSIGPGTAINSEGHWQYRGAPPVSRTIAGTVATPTGTPPGYALFGHWTRGCWGTMGFLKNVLMSVNIPVIPRSTLDLACLHATPYFPTENSYMSHGDDPYGFFREGATTVVPPIGAYLVDAATYDQWFTGPTEHVCSNVGRRDAELALALLPDSLALKYCDDIQQDKDHASSSVYAAFDSYYTLQELEAADLWNRLSQRAADLGLWCGGM